MKNKLYHADENLKPYANSSSSNCSHRNSYGYIAVLKFVHFHIHHVYENVRKVHNKTLHCTALHCTAPHRTAPHCTALHCTALHCTALHYTTLHCTALHCTALHCTALYCTALHCTALHCTALHCTALHCTALHCTTTKNLRNKHVILAGKLNDSISNYLQILLCSLIFWNLFQF